MPALSSFLSIRVHVPCGSSVTGSRRRLRHTVKNEGAPELYEAMRADKVSVNLAAQMVKNSELEKRREQCVSFCRKVVHTFTVKLF
jgi:hypothetical protein